MTRIATLLALVSTLAATGCNEHPLKTSEMDHWSDPASETDGEDGGIDPDIGTPIDEDDDDGGALGNPQGGDNPHWYCGDGEVQGDEQCDNGDANADDADCTSECAWAECGDGLVHVDEQCDPAADDSDRCNDDCELIDV